MRYLWAALTALAVIWGTVLTVRLLRQRNGPCSKRPALASGSLTLSVLFYAGPRVLDAFWKDDLAAVCGLGRLLAAVGVTLFTAPSFGLPSASRSDGCSCLPPRQITG